LKSSTKGGGANAFSRGEKGGLEDQKEKKSLFFGEYRRGGGEKSIFNLGKSRGEKGLVYLVERADFPRRGERPLSVVAASDGERRERRASQRFWTEEKILPRGQGGIWPYAQGKKGGSPCIRRGHERETKL